MIAVHTESSFRNGNSFLCLETYIDLAEEKQERKKNGNLELDLDFVVADGAGRTKLKTTEFR